MEPTDGPNGQSAPREVADIPVIRVVSNPLQRPGKDELVREVQLGGREAGQDRRLYLHRSELERMLERANQSITGRCVMDMVGLTVRLWRHKSGHLYETWSFDGVMKPEQPSAIAGLIGGR